MLGYGLQFGTLHSRSNTAFPEGIAGIEVSTIIYWWVVEYGQATLRAQSGFLGTIGVFAANWKQEDRR
jgi:hypothetical protein